MKGFGIEVKNTLLDPKHVDAMGGSALWLYLWLIDKMTSISEEGVGTILGGRPVRYEEVKAELGVSPDTYTRWIDKLLEYPYIAATRTPYGITFKVFKAHKRFGKRFRKNAESTSAHVRNLFRENAESNKTEDSNNTVDKKAEALFSNQKLFDKFKKIMGYNPLDSELDRQRYPRLIRLKCEKENLDIEKVIRWAYRFGWSEKGEMVYPWRRNLTIRKIHHDIIPRYLKARDEAKGKESLAQMKSELFKSTSISK